jgi:hypothetical protein
MKNIAVVAFPRAVNVLIVWVREVSFALESDQDEFLTLAMQTADFAFAYDRKEAETHMSRCDFVTSPCPPIFRRNVPHCVNILQEMLMSWNQGGASSLSRGVFFIKYVFSLCRCQIASRFLGMF